MNKFSVFCLAVALLTNMVLMPQVGQAEEIQIPRCEETWCFEVARPLSPWPTAYKGESVIVEDGPSILTAIPIGFTKIWRSGYSIHYFYGEKKVLTFNRITLDIFPELEESTKGSNFSVYDIWSAIFTKTPNDIKPEKPRDALRWDWGLSCMKKYYFRGGGPVYSSKNGSLTVYYLAGQDGLKARNAAIILNDYHRNVVLEINSTNIDFTTFKHIVGSITQKGQGERR